MREEGTDPGRGMVLPKSQDAAEQGAVLGRDRQHRDLGEFVRLEQQLTGEEMKESLSLKALSRELGTLQWQWQSEGDQTEKQQNLHLRVFQTCLNSPGCSHSRDLFQKERPVS